MHPTYPEIGIYIYINIYIYVLYLDIYLYLYNELRICGRIYIYMCRYIYIYICGVYIHTHIYKMLSTFQPRGADLDPLRSGPMLLDPDSDLIRSDPDSTVGYLDLELSARQGSIFWSENDIYHHPFRKLYFSPFGDM
jgi:hypothetical protein